MLIIKYKTKHSEKIKYFSLDNINYVCKLINEEDIIFSDVDQINIMNSKDRTISFNNNSKATNIFIFNNKLNNIPNYNISKIVIKNKRLIISYVSENNRINKCYILDEEAKEYKLVYEENLESKIKDEWIIDNKIVVPKNTILNKIVVGEFEKTNILDLTNIDEVNYLLLSSKDTIDTLIINNSACQNLKIYVDSEFPKSHFKIIIKSSIINTLIEHDDKIIEFNDWKTFDSIQSVDDKYIIRYEKCYSKKRGNTLSDRVIKNNIYIFIDKNNNMDYYDSQEVVLKLRKLFK